MVESLPNYNTVQQAAIAYINAGQSVLPSVQWSTVGERPTMQIRPVDLAAFIEGHRVDVSTTREAEWSMGND